MIICTLTFFLIHQTQPICFIADIVNEVVTDLVENLPEPLPAGVPRFEIKSWDAVAIWAWDMNVSNCAICRNHIMDLCIECQANRELCDPEYCAVAWGVCNHAFHYHCISRFLKMRRVCPLDNKEWEFLKFGRQSFIKIKY